MHTMVAVVSVRGYMSNRANQNMPSEIIPACQTRSQHDRRQRAISESDATRTHGRGHTVTSPQFSGT